MTTSQNDGTTADQEKLTEQDDIGYRRPPVRGQFKKGVSGNPFGRPRKKREPFWMIMMREAEREHPVSEGGKRKRMSTSEIFIARLTLKAATGDLRSIEALFKLMGDFEKKLGAGNVGWNEMLFSWDDDDRDMWKMAKQQGQEADQAGLLLN